MSKTRADDLSRKFAPILDNGLKGCFHDSVAAER